MHNPLKLIDRVLIGVGLYVLIPFIYIARYVHPAADDYAFALKFTDHSFIQVFTDRYLHWSGRYMMHILYWFNPTRYHSLLAYRGFAILIIITLVLVIIKAAKQNLALAVS